MNTLFLISEPLADSGGISKKILAQVNAIERCGMKVDLTYLKANDKNKCTGRYVNKEIVDRYSSITIVSEFQWRCKYKNLYNYIKINKIELIYIRYSHFANPFFISFLKKLSKNGIKVLLEIPTYPYDQEYRDIKFTSKIVLMIEKISRLRFKNYVTRIITLTSDTFIFGVPAIQISNGIDPDSINMIQKSRHDNDIHLIGVASIAYWHGYDRVIEGLNKYYSNERSNNKKIFFHVVGNNSNSESVRYQELVTRYQLNDYVIFYGKKSGKELDTLFDKADMAVGSLGCHRILINNIRSLKNREYCARGIPFFYSDIDDDFEDKDFILKFPANDDAINIDAIINFLTNNKFDAIRIRNYAVENLTWERQFKKILATVIPDFKTLTKALFEYGSS